MKYIVNIFVNEGVKAGTGLGIEWEVETSDPDWRKLLPDQQALAAVIEEDDMPSPPTKEIAAEVLRRLGYDDLADVVEERDVRNVSERLKKLGLKPLNITWTRNPGGDINNCALANGDNEEDCQVCDGRCPDRKKFGVHDEGGADDGNG